MTNVKTLNALPTVTTALPTDSVLIITDPTANTWALKQISAHNLTKAGRYVLTDDIHFYVRTDGNDNNDGLANTANGAWATLGHSHEYICEKIDLAGKTASGGQAV